MYHNGRCSRLQRPSFNVGTTETSVTGQHLPWESSYISRENYRFQFMACDHNRTPYLAKFRYHDTTISFNLTSTVHFITENAKTFKRNLDIREGVQVQSFDII
ncbi:hypothetical protein L798_13145 [Zootermopsis nevadensis]|uniref:Uncharacterized protein n=1 Tax=Zootermopsis nevadensis TaxID=136037 RepID=A0A067QUH8_ZOONE|nr:hypothetical protein L798_13145 [Zootermopsis nevadensis]